MYEYRSPVGEFVIEPGTLGRGRWQLGLREPDGSRRYLSGHRTIREAVRAVYDHRTGSPDWDVRPPDGREPERVGGWERHGRADGVPPRG